MDKQSLYWSPVSTYSSKRSSYACGLTHNKGMSKEAYCKAEKFPVGGRTFFHCLEFEWVEGCFGNCLVVSQPAACMLRDGLILGPDRWAQPHMSALGRVSTAAARAVSQVSYRECFWWDQKQSCQRGLPHPGQLEPGTRGVGAPAASSGERQGEGVRVASNCPSGRVSPTWTYSVLVGVRSLPFVSGHQLQCLSFLLEWLVIKFCPLFISVLPQKAILRWNLLGLIWFFLSAVVKHHVLPSFSFTETKMSLVLMAPALVLSKRTFVLCIYFGDDSTEDINRIRLYFHLYTYSSLTIME